MKKLLDRLCFTALMAALLAGIARADTDTDDTQTPLSSPPEASLNLMLDWYVNPTHGPIIIAQQKGFFRDLGLKVTIDTPADPTAPPKLVAAGREDLALSYQPQLHLQVDEGLPVKRVGTLIGTPLNALMVRADSDIHQVSDLKGKRVGYSVGGVEEVLLAAMLNHSGLDMDDVEPVNVNFALTPALLSRQVDAVTGAFRNFEPAQMAQEGVEGRAFYIEEEGVPIYDELIFLANTDTLDNQRALISRFMRAVEKATMWIVNHPEEGWTLFKSYDASLDNEVNHKAWEASIVRFALRPAALDTARYRDFENFLLDRGVIKKRVPVERLAEDVNATGN
ncbi:putative hydroxymethylpyrimidine transport system substrate-binding protein [Kushneria avicenniae]|uniref:Putative hydroxymethylpyrimidine transport system substrate-binding protein n=1 Tax=Kushneria avicenniae TaxID=402385 RepID=A0A1I1FLL3_9GAMM|nr:ABC transporter substrate-binding protein [Kushneria avicenniae]SFC00224.1 putative hydroxymethylpyrimidine transport system substrate-binding protein [Kushneria avicenniae]